MESAPFSGLFGLRGMKRSGFKRKPKQEKESKGLFDHLEKSSKGLFDNLKKESKDEECRRHYAEITPFFIANGLYDICELQLDVCIGNALPLQFAHSKKRIDIATEEPERSREMQEVVRACTQCHALIEHLPDNEYMTGRERMYKIVTDTIARRNRRLSKWKRV